MEPLILTAENIDWRRIEILQWMERNTLVFKERLGDYMTIHQYAAPLNSCYQSKKKINELLGIKEVMR